MVDTGPWISGRKVVLPVGTVRRIDHEECKVYVDSESYRQRLGDYYADSYRMISPM